MPERGTVAVVLVDGPSAGLVIETAPTCTTWCQSDPITPFVYDPTATATTWMPKYTTYCIRPTWWRLPTSSDAGSVEVGIRVGWSSPEGLQESAVRRHVRAALLEHPDLIPPGARVWPSDPADDEPIQILNQGTGTGPLCQDMFEMVPHASLARGRCPACGWQTEDVEPRRFEELRGLTGAHGQAGMRALSEVLRAGVVSRADFAGILDEANAATGHRGVVGTIEGAATEAAPTLYWGEPLAESDAQGVARPRAGATA